MWLTFTQESNIIDLTLSARELGYKGIEIGKELNLGSAGVSRALQRGEVALRKNPGLKKRIVGELVK